MFINHNIKVYSRRLSLVTLILLLVQSNRLVHSQFWPHAMLRIRSFVQLPHYPEGITLEKEHELRERRLLPVATSTEPIMDKLHVSSALIHPNNFS